MQPLKSTRHQTTHQNSQTTKQPIKQTNQSIRLSTQLILSYVLLAYHFVFFSYTEENLLNLLSNWLGTSQGDQTSNCHMQVLIPKYLAQVLYQQPSYKYSTTTTTTTTTTITTKMPL